ncbi:MAG: hypothetical protein Fur002_21450 [Anaerolineales bacterium]
MTPTNVCPFLGLQDDPDSHQAYASEANYCYRGANPQPIRITHQGKYCLEAAHAHCAVFHNAAANTQRIYARVKPAKKRWVSQRNVIALAIALLVIFLFEQILLRPAATPPAAVSATALQETSTCTPTLAPSETPKPQASATPTPTLHLPIFGSVTARSSPTPTASATFAPYVSKHQLNIPIGTDKRFVIRRLETGERLDEYLLQYNTTFDAVKQINYDLYLQNPVIRDVLVVFPYNFFDVSGLNSLTVYQTQEPERGANYEYLALILHVDLETFQRYNGITSFMERPLVGEYYLVPQKRIIP